MTYSFWSYHGPGVDSAPSENEYQEHFLGVKAAGAWGWQPYHLHVSNVMKIWEPKPPGTLWATPGLLRDSFTFTFYFHGVWNNFILFTVLPQLMGKWLYCLAFILLEGKGKGLPQQAELAQGVLGRLRPQIFLTFGTMMVVGRHPYTPAAFTPGEIPGTHF
jgi:hypothetical protein